MSTPHPHSIKIDAAIVGGGIAGLWLLNLLSNKGYNVVVLERDSLGCDQTLASQGMVHGGMKYALAGALSGASEAIADMPSRWRQCIGGTEDVDLSGIDLLSENYYMFAASLAGRFASLAGARALRGRIDKLDNQQWPEAFDGFSGTVYQLNDFVLDTPSLLRRLVEGLEHRAFLLHADSDRISYSKDGYVVQLDDVDLVAKHIISCAGNGAAQLVESLKIPNIEIQQRPLKQVIARPQHDVRLFGHCLTSLTTREPRLTITTHEHDGQIVWYLGGELASRGVDEDDSAQIAIAKADLERYVGWLDWRDTEFSVKWVNRAEPKQLSGLKPDEAHVQREDNFIQCFPTKLTLAPDMGDKLLNVIDPPSHDDNLLSAHPRAQMGQPPWN